MSKVLHKICILFYLSILVVIVTGYLGLYDHLYASPKVIETFQAGPIKEEKRHVVKVKTHFEWDVENPCPCNGENPPCVKTFLNNDLPTEETRLVQVNNHLNQSSEKYQGSQTVPALIRNSSVRLIVVPFCRQAQSDEKGS